MPNIYLTAKQALAIGKWVHSGDDMAKVSLEERDGYVLVAQSDDHIVFDVNGEAVSYQLWPGASEPVGAREAREFKREEESNLRGVLWFGA